MLRPGDPWAVPVDRPADLDVQGSDADLARAIATCDGTPVVHWMPETGTDLGRSVGRAAGTDPVGDLVAPMDCIRIDGDLAVNAVTWGVEPSRVRSHHRMRPVTVIVDGRIRWSAPAFAVVIANGEFVNGMPVAPRAHPGDGRLDVAVFAVPAQQRRTFRARLRLGDHLPHPQVATARGGHIVVEGARPAPVTIDGVARGHRSGIEAHCESDRWRLIL